MRKKKRRKRNKRREQKGKELKTKENSKVSTVLNAKMYYA
jgi:hypothetical protein